jgi:uridine kinase
MIGDRLIFEKHHSYKAERIHTEIVKEYFERDYCGDKFVITIGGESGTGKTEIAILLQELFWEKHNLRSYVISLDDYYKVPSLMRRETRKKQGIKSIGVKEISWDKVNHAIETFINPIYTYLSVQRIHKFVNDIEECKIKRDSIDILILEGLYANRLKKDYGVYLEGSYKETEDFRRRRKKETMDDFRTAILIKEREEVLKTKDKANLIIPRY